MKKLLLFLILILVQSCSEIIGSDEYQDIAELQWKHDGSGMVGFVEHINANASVQASGLFDIYSIRTDGSLDKKSSSGYRAVQDVSFTIFMGDDGMSAVTQLGAYNTCRIDLTSLAVTPIIPDLHLYAVSPDLRFVVGSYSPPRQPIKTVSVYDVSVSPVRLVQSFDLPNIKNTRGIWLDSGRYALAVNDSAGSHIEIFDTLAGKILTFPNTDISNHNVAYFPGSGNLYVRDNAQWLVLCNLQTRERQTLINLDVKNFSITNDESTCVFTVFEEQKIKLKKRRLPSGIDETLADDDIIRGPFLSPDNKKIAYIRSGGINIDVVKIIDL